MELFLIQIHLLWRSEARILWVSSVLIGKFRDIVKTKAVPLDSCCHRHDMFVGSF